MGQGVTSMMSQKVLTKKCMYGNLPPVSLFCRPELEWFLRRDVDDNHVGDYATRDLRDLLCATFVGPGRRFRKLGYFEFILHSLFISTYTCAASK